MNEAPKPQLELDPSVDLEIDLHELTNEFKRFSILMYRYCQVRARMEKRRDIAKAFLKETRARAYKRIKSDRDTKHSEKSLEAEIDCDQEVLDAQKKFIDAEHDASTWNGAVDSMKAKKDCLIQLGSDRRKEI